MKNINTRGFANVAVVVIGLLLVGLGSYAMIQNRAHAPTATPTVNTSDWKTYKNDRYGFEFKYPKELEVGMSNYEPDTSGYSQPYFYVAKIEPNLETDFLTISVVDRKKIDYKELYNDSLIYDPISNSWVINKSKSPYVSCKENTVVIASGLPAFHFGGKYLMLTEKDFISVSDPDFDYLDSSPLKKNQHGVATEILKSLKLDKPVIKPACRTI